MKIVITAAGRDLSAPISPVFGRCPTYLFVDADTLAFEAVDNPAVTASGGAGIQAAQFIIQQGAQAVVSNNVGPNALSVLRAAGVPIYACSDGSVADVVRAFRAGQLPLAQTPTAGQHSGLAAGMASPAPRRPSAEARATEIKQLQQEAAQLRQQLAALLERIEQLQEG